MMMTPSPGPLPEKAKPRLDKLMALAINVNGDVGDKSVGSDLKMAVNLGQLKAIANTRKTSARGKRLIAKSLVARDGDRLAR